MTGTAANPAGLLVYDEAGHIIGEYNSSTGKASKEFVYLGDTPVGVLEQVATGTAPNQAYATNVYFIYTDHLDTPRVITRSPDGQMVWRWDSGDPFGLLPPNDNPAGLGAFTFNLRMPGQYYDRSTNLSYNYYRDYDAQTGRYIQSDPIGLAGGINTYAYVGGNPLTRMDPDGRFAVNGVAAVGGAVFGGAFGFFSAISYQIAGCKSVSDIDWWSVASSTGLGAVSGAITGATFGAGGAAFQAGMGLTAGMSTGHVAGAVAGGLENAGKNGSVNCECKK